MAELLIKATDHTHPDPVINRAGCYKRGMVVRIENDGFEWGKKEGPPKFAVVRILGAPASDYEKLVDAETRDDSGVDTGDTYRRRSYRLDVDALAPDIREKMSAQRKVDIPAGDIDGHLKRIRDGKLLQKGPRTTRKTT